MRAPRVGDDLAPAPRATELAVSAFKIAAAHYRALVVTVAVVFVPTMVVGGLVLEMARSQASARPSNAGASVTEMAALLVVVVGSLLSQAVGVHAATSAVVGATPDWRVSCRAALSRWPVVVVTGVVASLSSAVGLLVFVLPGIVIYLNFFVVMPVVVIDGARTGPALRRSSALVRGRRMTVLGALLLVELGTAVCSLPIAVAAGALISRSHTAEVAVQQLGASLVSMLVMPVAVVLVVLVYLDGCRRVDGATAVQVASRVGIAAADPTAQLTGWAPPGFPVSPGWGAGVPGRSPSRDRTDADRTADLGWPAASPKPSADGPTRPERPPSWPSISPKPSPPTRSPLRSSDGSPAPPGDEPA